MKKCLLIGGAGFIGSNLAKCFSENGVDVTVFDIVEMPEWISKRYPIKFVKGNYFSDKIDRRLLKGQDIVVLLACSVGPKSSMDDPQICYNTDIIKMIELLDEMKNSSVKKLIFISSGGTVYGNCNADVISEDMPTNPINHYGILKLTQEKIVLMYNELYNMKNVIFRLANPYGPGQNESNGVGVITRYIRRIMKSESICIWGKGDVTRDYVYIDDVAVSICKFLNAGEKDDLYPVYNIGSGQGSSLIDIIKVIENVTGKNAEIEFSDKRDIDVRRNVLSMNKLHNIIGECKYHSIVSGIDQYYLWLKERGYDD